MIYFKKSQFIIRNNGDLYINVEHQRQYRNLKADSRSKSDYKHKSWENFLMPTFLQVIQSLQHNKLI
jgi:hypothetical protein